MFRKGWDKLKIGGRHRIYPYPDSQFYTSHWMLGEGIHTRATRLRHFPLSHPNHMNAGHEVGPTPLTIATCSFHCYLRGSERRCPLTGSWEANGSPKILPPKIHLSSYRIRLDGKERPASLFLRQYVLWVPLSVLSPLIGIVQFFPLPLSDIASRWHL